MDKLLEVVLVPFYRGAVVFGLTDNIAQAKSYSSRPLLSRSGCIWYLAGFESKLEDGSRPLLSRSGCI